MKLKLRDDRLLGIKHLLCYFQAFMRSRTIFTIFSILTHPLTDSFCATVKFNLGPKEKTIFDVMDYCESIRKKINSILPNLTELEQI